MINSLVFNAKARLQKYKKASYTIGDVSKKDFYEIIKEFVKFDKLPYEKRRPKHEPTDSYFNLARQCAKFMVRSNNLNWYDHVDYTEMTAPSLNITATDEDKSTTHHRSRRFIGELFYGCRRIKKTKHCWAAVM